MGSTTLILQIVATSLWLPLLVYWLGYACSRPRTLMQNSPELLLNLNVDDRWWCSRLRPSYVPALVQCCVFALVTYAWVGAANYARLPHPNLVMLHTTFVWLFVVYTWVTRFAHSHATRTLVLYTVLQLHIGAFWIESRIAQILVQLALVSVDTMAVHICFRSFWNVDDDDAHNDQSGERTSSRFRRDTVSLVPSALLCALVASLILLVGTGHEHVDRFLCVLLLVLTTTVQLRVSDSLDPLEPSCALCRCGDSQTEPDSDLDFDAYIESMNSEQGERM